MNEISQALESIYKQAQPDGKWFGQGVEFIQNNDGGQRNGYVNDAGELCFADDSFHGSAFYVVDSAAPSEQEQLRRRGLYDYTIAMVIASQDNINDQIIRAFTPNEKILVDAFDFNASNINNTYYNLVEFNFQRFFVVVRFTLKNIKPECCK
jgi:hypothetical protein